MQFSFFQSYFSYVVLSGLMNSALGLQNEQRRLLSAVSERISVICDRESDLESTMPRPTSWLYTKLHTYMYCVSRQTDLMQPGVLVDTNSLKKNENTLSPKTLQFECTERFSLEQQLCQQVQSFNKSIVELFVLLSSCLSLIRLRPCALYWTSLVKS